jgi:hypothetical protein
MLYVRDVDVCIAFGDMFRNHVTSKDVLFQSRAFLGKKLEKNSVKPHKFCRKAHFIKKFTFLPAKSHKNFSFPQRFNAITNKKEENRHLTLQF